jgi:hypothetical protein
VVLPDHGSLFCRTTRSPTAERPSERPSTRLVLSVCDLAVASRVQHGQRAQLFFFFEETALTVVLWAVNCLLGVPRVP